MVARRCPLQGGGREGDGFSARALEVRVEPNPTLTLPLNFSLPTSFEG